MLTFASFTFFWGRWREAQWFAFRETGMQARFKFGKRDFVWPNRDESGTWNSARNSSLYMLWRGGITRITVLGMKQAHQNNVPQGKVHAIICWTFVCMLSERENSKLLVDTVEHRNVKLKVSFDLITKIIYWTKKIRQPRTSVRSYQNIMCTENWGSNSL